MAEIVILGSGFAGLTAVKTLRRRGYKGQIRLVSPKPELLYYPSLIWVPAGLRSEADLRIKLDGFFSRHRVEYVADRVTGLNPGARLIFTEGTGEIPFERLLIASGGQYIRKLPGLEHVFIPCVGWEPTKAYSDRLEQMTGGALSFGFAANPNEPTGMRGGPMFEFLFGIDTLLRRQGRRERFEICFFSPAPKPGQRLGEKAFATLMAEMTKRGIRSHLGHKIESFAPDRVITAGGELKSDLTLFMPGLTGPAWAPRSGLPLSPGGFIQADARCRVPGFEGVVYIAGDAGSFPGPEWMPKQAHAADLQARAAVKNLLAEKDGKTAEQGFRPELICIVDTLDAGVLVFRDLKRSLLLGGSYLHWVKRAFESYYLRSYR